MTLTSYEEPGESCDRPRVESSESTDTDTGSPAETSDESSESVGAQAVSRINTMPIQSIVEL